MYKEKTPCYSALRYVDSAKVIQNHIRAALERNFMQRNPLHVQWRLDTPEERAIRALQARFQRLNVNEAQLEEFRIQLQFICTENLDQNTTEYKCLITSKQKYCQSCAISLDNAWTCERLLTKKSKTNSPIQTSFILAKGVIRCFVFIEPELGGNIIVDFENIQLCWQCHTRIYDLFRLTESLFYGQNNGAYYMQSAWAGQPLRMIRLCHRFFEEHVTILRNIKALRFNRSPSDGLQFFLDVLMNNLRRQSSVSGRMQGGFVTVASWRNSFQQFLQEKEIERQTELQAGMQGGSVTAAPVQAQFWQPHLQAHLRAQSILNEEIERQTELQAFSHLQTLQTQRMAGNAQLEQWKTNLQVEAMCHAVACAMSNLPLSPNSGHWHWHEAPLDVNVARAEQVAREAMRKALQMSDTILDFTGPAAGGRAAEPP